MTLGCVPGFSESSSLQNRDTCITLFSRKSFQPVVIFRHGWLHYMTDKTPVEEPPTERKWMADHTENFTGTNKQYVPYSTGRPKIEAWKPPSSR